MSRIFLSHSSENNAEAIALRDWLVSHGWDDLFLDLDPERGLKVGERWQEALKQAAERCELVIFLVSPDWAASKWCFAEFVLAKNLSKRIFGVIVEPTPLGDLPVEMTAEWQLVDLTAGKRDRKVRVTPPGDKTVTVSFAKDGLERLRIGMANVVVDLGKIRNNVWREAAACDDVVNPRFGGYVLTHHVDHDVHRFDAVEGGTPPFGCPSRMRRMPMKAKLR